MDYVVSVVLVAGLAFNHLLMMRPDHVRMFQLTIIAGGVRWGSPHQPV
jgi:hypothetical protein